MNVAWNRPIPVSPHRDLPLVPLQASIAWQAVLVTPRQVATLAGNCTISRLSQIGKSAATLRFLYAKIYDLYTLISYDHP